MILLTTGEAAELVGVHDSTIKRWCDAEELPCSFTGGGHRRIELSDLLDFARSEGLRFQLLDFGNRAPIVWNALARLQSEGSAEELVTLMYKWLQGPSSELTGNLLKLCHERKVPLPVIFDQIVTCVLHRIGEGWHAGDLDVGDEHRMTGVINDALYHLRPSLLEQAQPARHSAIVGCGESNEHEIGALMARLLLEAYGWEVVYLGARVPAEEFLKQQKAFSASLVCVSLTAPQVASDARRIARVLSKLYEPSSSFKLVMGGGAIHGVTEEYIQPHPFADFRLFDSMSRFSDWLNGVPSILPTTD